MVFMQNASSIYELELFQAWVIMYDIITAAILISYRKTCTSYPLPYSVCLEWVPIVQRVLVNSTRKYAVNVLRLHVKIVFILLITVAVVGFLEAFIPLASYHLLN